MADLAVDYDPFANHESQPAQMPDASAAPAPQGDVAVDYDPFAPANPPPATPVDNRPAPVRALYDTISPIDRVAGAVQKGATDGFSPERIGGDPKKGIGRAPSNERRQE